MGDEGGLQITVDGVPVAWERAGLQTRDKDGRLLKKPRHYTPADTKAFETLLGWHAKQAMRGRSPYAGAVTIEIVVRLPIPPTWPKWRRDLAAQQLIWATGKPDWDNYGKAVCDGLNGIAYVDDAQIVAGSLRKEYAIKPAVIVWVFFMAEELRPVRRVPRGARKGAL